jgi:repressor LexA
MNQDIQLTDRQEKILHFIRDKIESRGYGPTVREIGDQFAIRSPNGVACHLKALVKKGMIQREANRSRAIQLTDLAVPPKGLPVSGKVAGGRIEEVPADADYDEYVDFSDMFSADGGAYSVLEVESNDLEGANIVPGDYLVVKKQTRAGKGQLAMVRNDDGSLTIHRWMPESGKKRVKLESLKKGGRATTVKNAKVQGVVVGVVREV